MIFMVPSDPNHSDSMTGARAAPWGSPYLLQVLVTEPQILILFFHEQHPQLIHL